LFALTLLSKSTEAIKAGQLKTGGWFEEVGGKGKNVGEKRVQYLPAIPPKENGARAFYLAETYLTFMVFTPCSYPFAPIRTRTVYLGLQYVDTL